MNHNALQDDFVWASHLPERNETVIDEVAHYSLKADPADQI